MQPCISSTPLFSVELERSLKPYSLVRPLLVSALRPVVLLPECLAPRLIRNLLDLPSSRLDFQVCPAGESVATCVGEWIGMGWRGTGWHWTVKPVALVLHVLVLSRKFLWRGTVHILSSRSPQGLAFHPRAGQQDPSHPGVCWEGKCWRGLGCHLGPGTNIWAISWVPRCLPCAGWVCDHGSCGHPEVWAGISYLNIIVSELLLSCLLVGAAGRWLWGK